MTFNIREAVDGYIDCAILDLDPEEITDDLPISGQARESAERMIRLFARRMREDINGLEWCTDSSSDYSHSVGYMLWHTQTHAGTGFWDISHHADVRTRELSNKATHAANALGEVWAYLGDDGAVYLTQ